MSRILFECAYFKIRVREVLIVLLVLILLFFGFKSCQDNEVEKKKEEKIENICGFTNENINDFHRLMTRADLCSEGWFKDFDAYTTRIKEQTSYLKKKDKKEYNTVLTYQKDFLKELKNFKEHQDDKQIDKLEKAFKKYKTYYDGTCKKEKQGE